MSVFIGYPSFMAYQMMKGKKDNNEGFPTIPGTIARYSALGLTNEQMAANPVWVDKTGNGHDLQMKNFAWKGMSGVGGYVTNKDIYEYDLDHYSYTFIESSAKVHDFYIVFELIGYDENFKDGFNLDVRSISQGLKYRKTYTKNGIYIFQYKDEEGLDDLFAIGYNGNGGARSNFTVKVLPLYPGFILGDGVDDFAVTEKELNFEDTYTVYTAFIPFQDDPARTMSLCGKNGLKDFYMYYSSLDSIGFFSVDKSVSTLLSNGFNLMVCKKTSDKMLIKNLITGKVAEVSVDDLIYNPGLYYLWRSATIVNYSKTAIAGQIICNGHFTTDEEDEKVLNWHKKQYSWLFPDQAWTVTGKTNEGTDRATIANITGNGNDLVLSNSGFAEGSGYNEEGEYAGYLVTDGVDDKIVSSVFGMGKDFTIVGDWKFIDNKKSGTGLVKGSSFYIYNTMIGLDLYINSGSVKNSLDGIKGINAACSDGRAYDRNWNEILANTGNVVGSGGPLEVSSSGGRFDRIAFKNLAIYPRILSKDDCIKAYNYLQTLKAK